MELETFARSTRSAAERRETESVLALAAELKAYLEEPLRQSALRGIAPIGASSHEVDEIVRPCAERLGFSSQRLGLFAEYETRLRPDWYLPVGDSGILLEVERGKTLTNNMDLLDFWKCHICREADHLFLVVPMVIARTNANQIVYERIRTRMATFFAPGNEVNVRSVAVLGYP